jgi:hypothetical protein
MRSVKDLSLGKRGLVSIDGSNLCPAKMEKGVGNRNTSSVIRLVVGYAMRFLLVLPLSQAP